MYIATPLVLIFFRSALSLGAFAFFLSVIAVLLIRVWIPDSAPVFLGTNLINALEMAPYFKNGFMEIGAATLPSSTAGTTATGGVIA